MAKKQMNNEADTQLKNEAKTKSPNYFFSEEKREEIVKQLEAAGLETKELDDTQLLKKLTESYSRITNDFIKKETNVLAEKLSGYGAGSLITNKAFVKKLFDLGVPKIYLKLFRNEDSELTKEQIWDRIRFSGIRPIKDIQEIFKMRSRETPRRPARVQTNMDYE